MKSAMGPVAHLDMQCKHLTSHFASKSEGTRIFMRWKHLSIRFMEMRSYCLSEDLNASRRLFPTDLSLHNPTLDKDHAKSACSDGFKTLRFFMWKLFNASYHLSVSLCESCPKPHTTCTICGVSTLLECLRHHSSNPFSTLFGGFAFVLPSAHTVQVISWLLSFSRFPPLSDLTRSESAGVSSQPSCAKPPRRTTTSLVENSVENFATRVFSRLIASPRLAYSVIPSDSEDLKPNLAIHAIALTVAVASKLLQ
mmetsp:Transcript_182/g.346  ORF Transcript_182/g.346 Transcript_182/m.346 type:complete len:253 (-) Transcript_182:693-1451(-)